MRSLETSEITNLLSDLNSLRENRFDYINPAWLAGFIDGEGSLHFTMMSNGYKMPRISIALTDYNILDGIKEIYGGNISKMKNSGNHKQAWRWQLSGPKMINLLIDVVPFLKLKDRQAKLILEFNGLLISNQNERQLGISLKLLAKRQLIITEVAKLNKRGIL